MENSTYKYTSIITKLGKILTPLPGALFTPSFIYQIPVFKDDETRLSWDELVFSHTEQHADIAIPPTSTHVVSRPQGSSSDRETSAPSGIERNELKGSDSDKKDTDDANDEGEDENSGDREGNDGNPDDENPSDPTDGSLSSELPSVYFDAKANINNVNTAPPRRIQTLQVNGRLIIQVSCTLFSLPED